MKKRLVLFGIVILVSLLGVLTPQFAQDAPKAVEGTNPKNHDHALLLGFVRTINTAEVADFYEYGSYASWQTLLAHNQEYLNEWLSKFYSPEAKVHFGDMPEILPGWSLRLSMQSDGRGYVLVLEDATDKDGYAALSDERGIIRECKFLN
jgi:hypothetical protein